MDITSINKRVRVYLDNYGLDNVSLGIPMFDDKQWYVSVVLGDKLLGIVILDKDGEVLLEISYPNY
ncbi:MAG: hypothetical protein WC196_04445 [Bacilli bacterium]|jgi:hypothetical protein